MRYFQFVPVVLPPSAQEPHSFGSGVSFYPISPKLGIVAGE